MWELLACLQGSCSFGGYCERDARVDATASPVENARLASLAQRGELAGKLLLAENRTTVFPLAPKFVVLNLLAHRFAEMLIRLSSACRGRTDVRFLANSFHMCCVRPALKGVHCIGLGSEGPLGHGFLILLQSDGYATGNPNAVLAQVAQARNMSIGEHRHCCVTFKI